MSVKSVSAKSNLFFNLMKSLSVNSFFVTKGPASLMHYSLLMLSRFIVRNVLRVNSLALTSLSGTGSLARRRLTISFLKKLVEFAYCSALACF